MAITAQTGALSEARYDGIELDREYREKTMEHIFYLWDRPIHMERVDEKK
jgi:stage V sporulation protein R